MSLRFNKNFESSVGWIEISPDALRKMRGNLEETVEGVVDEIGVLSIHSGYANRFFPGTSVLQTRPRYLFFTSWNYLALANMGDVDAHNAWNRKRAAENWVTERLLENEGLGVIGGKIYPKNPVQSPDFIYWTALGAYGFYRGPGRRALLSNWRGDLIGRVNDRFNYWDEERLYRQAALFHAPPVAKKWLGPRSHRDLNFSLTGQEAAFLQRALIGIDPPCLLSEAAKLIAIHRGKIRENLWKDNLMKKAAKSLGLTQMLGRAQLASSLAKLVRAVYGALVEKIFLNTISDDLKENIKEKHYYLDVLKGFWKNDGGEDLRFALSLDIDDLSRDIPTLPKQLTNLLSHLQEKLAKVKNPLQIEKTLLGGETIKIFERIESNRKGRRARLPETPAGYERRLGFEKKPINVYGLDYRWKQVQAILTDLKEGLRG